MFRNLESFLLVGLLVLETSAAVPPTDCASGILAEYTALSTNPAVQALCSAHQPVASGAPYHIPINGTGAYNATMTRTVYVTDTTTVTTTSKHQKRQAMHLSTTTASSTSTNGGFAGLLNKISSALGKTTSSTTSTTTTFPVASLLSKFESDLSSLKAGATTDVPTTSLLSQLEAEVSSIKSSLSVDIPTASLVAGVKSVFSKVEGAFTASATDLTTHLVNRQPSHTTTTTTSTTPTASDEEASATTTAGGSSTGLEEITRLLSEADSVINKVCSCIASDQTHNSTAPEMASHNSTYTPHYHGFKNGTHKAMGTITITTTVHRQVTKTATVTA